MLFRSLGLAAYRGVVLPWAAGQSIGAVPGLVLGGAGVSLVYLVALFLLGGVPAGEQKG